MRNDRELPTPDILLRTVFVDGWPFFAMFILVAAYGAIAMWILVSGIGHLGHMIYGEFAGVHLGHIGICRRSYYSYTMKDSNFGL